MTRFASIEDRNAIEAEKPWEERDVPATMYQFLSNVAEKHGERPAVSYQITSGPDDKAETLAWGDLLAKVTQARSPRSCARRAQRWW